MTAAAGLGLVAASLVACSSGGGGTGATGPRTTLNVTLSTESNDFNPFTGTMIGKGQFFDATQTPLVGMDDSGEIIGRLADSWEISPDASTVTVTLKDATWSDGEPITSADVAFTYARYLNPQISANSGRVGLVVGQEEFNAGTADTVSGMETPDDSTIIFHLATPNAAWVSQLASLDKFFPILPEHALGDVALDALADDDFFTSWPIASGPYKLDEWKSGQYAHLVKNDKWWDGTAAFEDVYMRVLESDAALAQLTTGELQFASPVTAKDKDALTAKSDGFQVLEVPGIAPAYLQFNNADPLLQDPRIKQAMVYAIDRDGICKTILLGACSVPANNLRQLGPEWALADNGDLTEYPHDVDKAKSLLAEAGWNPDTTITLVNRPGDSAMDNAVNVIQSNLAEAGINVEITNTDTPGLLTMAETFDSYQMFMIGGGNFAADPDNLASYTRCSARYPAGANMGQYCVDGLDAKWDAGLATGDQAERTSIYHDIYTTINSNPDGVSLYVPDGLAAASVQLDNVTIHGNPSSVYWNIGHWTWKK